MNANEPAVCFEVKEEHIALVTLNRPDVRNAVNVEIVSQLTEMVAQTEADPAIRAIVLTGHGPVFCAGADLRLVAAGQADALWTKEGGFAGFVFAPRAKPWICALNGSALAGGLEVALACDLIIAAEDASFSLPEVKRGLIAAGGGVHRLPRALPRAIALEMLATGESLDARRAWTLGLINRLVRSSNDVIDEAFKLARTIAANAPLAVRESLDIGRQVYDLDETDLKKRTAAARAYLQTTEDYKEGPRAFIERRQPRWSGR